MCFTQYASYRLLYKLCASSCFIVFYINNAEAGLAEGEAEADFDVALSGSEGDGGGGGGGSSSNSDDGFRRKRKAGGRKRGKLVSVFVYVCMATWLACVSLMESGRMAGKVLLVLVCNIKS